MLKSLIFQIVIIHPGSVADLHKGQNVEHSERRVRQKWVKVNLGEHLYIWSKYYKQCFQVGD